MKHLKSSENKKPKIKFLVGTLLLIGALLITTKLVQKSQDTRSSAASKCSCSKRAYGNAYSCSKNKGKWTCITTPVKKATPTPVKKPTPRTNNDILNEIKSKEDALNDNNKTNEDWFFDNVKR